MLGQVYTFNVKTSLFFVSHFLYTLVTSSRRFVLSAHTNVYKRFAKCWMGLHSYEEGNMGSIPIGLPIYGDCRLTARTPKINSPISLAINFNC